MTPRILISNDDGVSAPGLRQLVAAIHGENDFCSFSVSGPVGERSAQSHCITVTKHIHVVDIEVDGAEEAYAVDGTPADSVMLALYGPLMKKKDGAVAPQFELVVSGINRGDNCGLHVIYSGTVAAAREAACKDVPAVAFSLDNYRARAQPQFEAAAACAVAFVRAMLGTLPGTSPSTLHTFAGYVINVNIPGVPLEEIKGFYLARQGQHCVFPNFVDVEPDAHFDGGGDGGRTGLRAFRNGAGFVRTDTTPGTDSWAMHHGWVAVTALGLQQDVPMSSAAAAGRTDARLMADLAAVAAAAAAHLGKEVAGVKENGKTPPE
jgi:5'-nucleotidase